MENIEMIKTLSEQFQLLAERSKGTVDNDELCSLTKAMIELVKVCAGL